MSDIEMTRSVIREIAMTTRYTVYQIVRVIELLSKHDVQAVYVMTKKQRKIYRLLCEKLEKRIIEGEKNDEEQS